MEPARRADQPDPAELRVVEAHRRDPATSRVDREAATCIEGGLRLGQRRKPPAMSRASADIVIPKSDDRTS